MSGDCAEYWLLRLQHAVESAASAGSERSRSAFLDLAGHYWSMHMMVHGRTQSDHPAVVSLMAAISSQATPELRWAA
jgi:hypothetical protein